MSEITRIVRLSFIPEKMDEFMEIYATSSPHIRAFDGCLLLKLKRDYHHPNVLYTYSVWADHQALDKYRDSDLFKTTWAKTKVLFDAKPYVYSLLDVVI